MSSTPSARRSSPSTRDNWRLLQDAAESFLNDGEHYGFIVAGKFQRGQHRGGGRHVGSYDRDRARALQLLVRGLDRARTDPDRATAGRYLLALAEAAMGDRAQTDSWRLQSLTPLDVLPDYDESPYRSTGAASRPPAPPSSPTGRPSITGCPPSFAKAKNDGERWRWALAQAVESDPGHRNAARWHPGRLPPRPVRHPDDRGRGARRRTLRRPPGLGPMRSTPSPTTRPSPGSPPASSGSSSPTSSTSSRSTRRSPTTRRWARRKKPSPRWRRSSRIAASSTGPPTI